MIQRPRVLIVDNDAAFRGELTAVLKRDCVVMSANGGMEAYTLALDHHPDVIISEFHTPGWTGPRLINQLRQHRILGRVPVIILTADNSRSAVQAALKASADDYLLKENITPDLLLDRIRRAVGIRQQAALVNTA
jgi:two-component system sensor histidine kinase and response regulator WspE